MVGQIMYYVLNCAYEGITFGSHEVCTDLSNPAMGGLAIPNEQVNYMSEDGMASMAASVMQSLGLQNLPAANIHLLSDPIKIFPELKVSR
jgi:hypothetical protein